MIIFLYGTDTYRSRRKLNEILLNFRTREDKSGMNTTTLEASKVDIGEIQQALFAPAFLGNKRLVVINGLLALKRDEQKPFVDLIGKLPDSTTAVFYEDGEAKSLEKSPLLPLLTTGKFHWEFAPMSAGTMANWINTEAIAMGVSFAPQALAALAEAVGGDSARAANETAKLAAYVGEKKMIEVADVAALVVGETHEDMFGFLDAIAGKQTQRAATMLEKQIEAGIEPMQMLAMLARTVRLLLAARDLLDRGIPQNEAVRELGVHPFAARKSLDQARNFEMNFLRGLHTALLEADRKVKTGQTPTPRLVLDLFVAKAVGV
jgi:DNA polymerase-3 subunit delta